MAGPASPAKSYGIQILHFTAVLRAAVGFFVLVHVCTYYYYYYLAKMEVADMSDERLLNHERLVA